MVFQQLKLGGVNRAKTTLEGIAGKSINVAKVLKILNEDPLAVGFAGGRRGESVLATLSARGIETDFVQVAAETRECLTVIDESEHAQTEFVQESEPVLAKDYEMLLSTVEKRVRNAKAAVISGTLTPGGPEDFYLRCTQAAQRSDVFSVLDVQGTALLSALNAKPGLVKPNRLELQATVGRELSEEKAVLSIMRELHERGAQHVVITSGEEAALAFDGQTQWRIRSARITPINPIGSGDAFTAALVSHLLRGDDLGQACCWAAAAGAANALTFLAGELNPQEIELLMDQVHIEKVS